MSSNDGEAESSVFRQNLLEHRTLLAVPYFKGAVLL